MEHSGAAPADDPESDLKLRKLRLETEKLEADIRAAIEDAPAKAEKARLELRDLRRPYILRPGNLWPILVTLATAAWGYQTGFFSLQVSEIDNRKRIIKLSTEIDAQQERLTSLGTQITSANRQVAEKHQEASAARALSAAWAASATVAADAAMARERQAATMAATAASASAAAEAATHTARVFAQSQQRVYANLKATVLAAYKRELMSACFDALEPQMRYALRVTEPSSKTDHLMDEFAIEVREKIIYCIDQSWTVASAGSLSAADNTKYLGEIEKMSEDINNVIGEVISYVKTSKIDSTQAVSYRFSDDFQFPMADITSAEKLLDGKNTINPEWMEPYKIARARALAGAIKYHGYRRATAFPNRPEKLGSIEQYEPEFKF